MLRGGRRRAARRRRRQLRRSRRGETLGIVGETGCGKSTLARCLVRLHEPDSGRVRFEGADVLALSRAERARAFNRRVQMVFQDPYGSLNPRMTGRRLPGRGAAVHRVVARGERCGAGRASCSTCVHLPRDAAERYPHEFSGGQRQRIGIARALAVEPEMIIADEPVSALDVSVQAQIVNLLLELQNELGLALIFITHDLRLVRHIAASGRGDVSRHGSSRSARPTRSSPRPRHPYTRALAAGRAAARCQARAPMPPLSRASCRARSRRRPAAPSTRAARWPSRSAVSRNRLSSRAADAGPPHAISPMRSAAIPLSHGPKQPHEPQQPP